jgi:hypothetical protein
MYHLDHLIITNILWSTDTFEKEMVEYKLYSTIW